MSWIEPWIGVIGNLIVFVPVTMQANRVCARNRALHPHQGLLLAIVLFWLLVVPAKLLVIDRLAPPADAVGHERIAREIADHLLRGDTSSAFSYCVPGNNGFRFLLGVFYAVTRAPQSVIYGINAAFSCSALIMLLELLCQTTRAPRVPFWLTCLVCAPPSAVFWTVGVLKEGPVLWGIVVILCLTTRAREGANRPGMFKSLLGFLLVAFVRPHIAGAWLAGIWAGVVLRQRSVGVGVCGILGMMGSIAVLQQMLPGTMQNIMEAGVVETMEEEYERREGRGGSAITYHNGAPVPVLDGLLLIFFRPYPTEVSNMADVMAGLEIWIISGIAAVGWFRMRRRKAALMHPLLLSVLLALIPLAFYFTYFYNMGLMVRQRVMVYPAILTLMAAPVLYMSAQKVVQPRIPEPTQRRMPATRPSPRKLLEVSR